MELPHEQWTGFRSKRGGVTSEQQRRADARREEEKRKPESEGPAVGIPQPG